MHNHFNGLKTAGLFGLIFGLLLALRQEPHREVAVAGAQGLPVTRRRAQSGRRSRVFAGCPRPSSGLRRMISRRDSAKPSAA